MTQSVAPAPFVSAFSQLPAKPDYAYALTKQVTLFVNQRILASGAEKLPFPYKAVFLSKIGDRITSCSTQVIGTKLAPGNFASLQRFCTAGVEEMGRMLRPHELDDATVITVYIVFLKTQETSISFYAQKARCSMTDCSQVTTTEGERISTENGRSFIAAYYNNPSTGPFNYNDEIMRFLFPSDEALVVDLTCEEALPLPTEQLQPGEH